MSAPWGLRASGVQGDRSAQVEPTLRGSEERSRSRSARADGHPLMGEPPIRLQAGVGTPEARRLAGKQEAGASAVAQGRLQSAREATQEATPSPGGSENGCTRRRAEHKDHVWSYDFVMDLTEEGRRLKMMPVVDEYTRECLSIDVERSITAEDVVATLTSLFLSRGEPAYIRSGFRPRVHRQSCEAVAGSIRG